MRYQPKNKPYCGPTSLGNALEIYGDTVSMKKLLDVTDAKKVDGCNEFLLMQGIRELGYDYDELATNSSKRARLFAAALYPLLICVHTDEPWDHWVCVYPCERDRWWFIDSENNKKNKARNGVTTITWRGLKRIWEAPIRAQVDKGDCNYYGLAVKRV